MVMTYTRILSYTFTVRPSSQEGWFRGRLQRTGQVGLFPRTHVDLIDNSNTVVHIKELTITNKRQPSDRPPWIADIDWQEFSKLFHQQDPLGSGFLSAQQVKRIFKMSGLPTDTLARTWELCNVSSKGQLSEREFVLGMSLLSNAKTNAEPVPETLGDASSAWISSHQSSIADRRIVQSKCITPQQGPAFVHQTRVPLKGPSATTLPQHFLTNNADEPPKTAPRRQPAKPSAVDLLSFSQTAEGKDTAKNVTTIAQSDAGQKAGALAWENRDVIKKAAQSEAGQAAMSSAWQHKDKIGQGVGKAATMTSNKK